MKWLHERTDPDRSRLEELADWDELVEEGYEGELPRSLRFRRSSAPRAALDAERPSKRPRHLRKLAFASVRSIVKAAKSFGGGEMIAAVAATCRWAKKEASKQTTAKRKRRQLPLRPPPEEGARLLVRWADDDGSSREDGRYACVLRGGELHGDWDEPMPFSPDDDDWRYGEGEYKRRALDKVARFCEGYSQHLSKLAEPSVRLIADAKTVDTALHDALVSVAATCGLQAGVVTAAAWTDRWKKSTRLGLVQVATKVLEMSHAGAPLDDAFADPRTSIWPKRRSYKHLGDAKARARASDADRQKDLGKAYDALAAALAPFRRADDALLKPPKKAEGFSQDTGPRLLAPATDALKVLVAELEEEFQRPLVTAEVLLTRAVACAAEAKVPDPMRKKLIKWKLSGRTVAVTPITVIDARERVVPALDLKAPSKSPPKARTFGCVDRDTHEAEQEKKLRDAALAYPTTGRGAHSDHFRAQMTKTAAKVIEDFEEHKAAKLAARAAGADGHKTQINFQKFFNKLRIRKNKRYEK